MPDITAKINVNTQAGPEQVSVTLPSGAQLSNATLQLKLLGDVEMGSATDGALLQYRQSDGKFVARNEIITTTGSLTINAGSF